MVGSSKLDICFIFFVLMVLAAILLGIHGEVRPAISCSASSITGIAKIVAMPCEGTGRAGIAQNVMSKSPKLRYWNSSAS